MVRAAVVRQGRELRRRAGDHRGPGQPARINRARCAKPRDVLGILRTVLFAPEDLALVRGDPGERRRFLDDLLVARLPRFAGGARGLRAGAQAALGAAEVRPPRPVVTWPPCDVWDEHLAPHGAALLAGRLTGGPRMRAARRPAAFAAVAPSSRTDRLSATAPTLEGELAAATRPSWSAPAGRVRRLRSQELERGVCLVGPHRDELVLSLGVGPARGYASHGESWSLALALRLAAYGLLQADGTTRS